MFFWILVVLSTICALVGLSSLTEATLGVGLVAMGCWLGIMSRIRLVRTEPRPVSQAEVDNLYRMRGNYLVDESNAYRVE
jgi:hypothetical protein